MEKRETNKKGRSQVSFSSLFHPKLIWASQRLRESRRQPTMCLKSWICFWSSFYTCGGYLLFSWQTPFFLLSKPEKKKKKSCYYPFTNTSFMDLYIKPLTTPQFWSALLFPTKFNFPLILPVKLISYSCESWVMIHKWVLSCFQLDIL